MAEEFKRETFRAASDAFKREFGEFLMSRRWKRWRVRKCTFFRDGNRMGSWATCDFERAND